MNAALADYGGVGPHTPPAPRLPPRPSPRRRRSARLGGRWWRGARRVGGGGGFRGKVCEAATTRQLNVTESEPTAGPAARAGRLRPGMCGACPASRAHEPALARPEKAPGGADAPRGRPAGSGCL